MQVGPPKPAGYASLSYVIPPFAYAHLHKDLSLIATRLKSFVMKT